MQQNIRIDWMKEADLAAAASIEKMLFSDAWQENGFLETLQQKNALCSRRMHCVWLHILESLLWHMPASTLF